VKDGESNLSRDMKDKIRSDFTARYESRQLDTVLNTATFLDPRFKDTFVTMEEYFCINVMSFHHYRSRSEQRSSNRKINKNKNRLEKPAVHHHG